MSLDPALAAVRRGVRATLAETGPGDVVLVACSGGADSLALTAATVFEAGKLAVRVIGVTVDHGLQPESDLVTDRVVAQMAGLGCDETVTARVQVDGAGMGVEAAARRARYAILSEVADRVGARLVLLGHTRDDQAETVLLGLTHGSGPRSLAGMRRGYDRFRRPLLDVTRAQTHAACTVEGLDWWEDPHNLDPAYTRVRVRETVLPLLEAELGPGIAANLARTADLTRADVDHLDDLADRAWEAMAELGVEELDAMPVPIRTRVLRRAILAAGAPSGELTHEHITAVEGLVTRWHGQAWIDLPGHLRATRVDRVIQLSSTMQ
ncbi:tRNA lysidine(34) synthetase TilS [soil metagenome]